MQVGEIVWQVFSVLISLHQYIISNCISSKFTILSLFIVLKYQSIFHYAVIFLNKILLWIFSVHSVERARYNCVHSSKIN